MIQPHRAIATSEASGIPARPAIPAAGIATATAVALVALAAVTGLAPTATAAEPNHPPVVVAPASVAVSAAGDGSGYTYFGFSAYDEDEDNESLYLSVTYADNRWITPRCPTSQGRVEAYGTCEVEQLGRPTRPLRMTFTATDGEGASSSVTTTLYTTDYTSYATVGDSYASGEGLPAFDPGTDARAVPGDTSRRSCHRSHQAWSRTLEQVRPDLINVGQFACSGATTASLSTTFKGKPAQLTRLGQLRRATEAGEPGTVLVQIGGNDIGFGQVIAACGTGGRTTGCTAAAAAARTATSRLLPVQLRAAYARVRAASPQARIVVVGYPNIMSTLGRSASDRCPWITIANRRALAGVATALDQTIKEAARAAGAGYVSTLSALNGHELCSADPWVNRIDNLTPARVVDGTYAYAGHPNRAGQNAIRDRVATALPSTR